MVTSERHQCTDLMPSGAEIGDGITVETAEIATHEWQTEELVLVDVFDGVSHVFDPRPVVAKPMISVLLKTWLVRS